MGETNVGNRKTRALSDDAREHQASQTTLAATDQEAKESEQGVNVTDAMKRIVERARAISEMTSSRGWQHVYKCIRERIATCEIGLHSESSTSTEMVKLAAEIRGLEFVIGLVSRSAHEIEDYVSGNPIFAGKHPDIVWDKESGTLSVSGDAS